MTWRDALPSTRRWVNDYNKSHRRVEFEVGDLVLRPNVVLSSAADHYNKDLAALRVGPFEIVEKLSPTTFRLCNPASGAILKGSWNITKLRHYIPDAIGVVPTPLPDSGPLYVSEDYKTGVTVDPTGQPS